MTIDIAADRAIIADAKRQYVTPPFLLMSSTIAKAFTRWPAALDEIERVTEANKGFAELCRSQKDRIGMLEFSLASIKALLVSAERKERDADRYAKKVTCDQVDIIAKTQKERDALKTEVERLKAELASDQPLDRAHAENARLRAALEFYADPSHWNEDDACSIQVKKGHGFTVDEIDTGHVARAALDGGKS